MGRAAIQTRCSAVSSRAPAAVAVPVPCLNPASDPGPGPSLTPAVVPDGHNGTDVAAELDAVLIGLPAQMTELQATGAINAAGRRLHTDRFRLGRGPLADHQRIAAARPPAEIGTEAVVNPYPAATRKIGISAPETPTQQAAS